MSKMAGVIAIIALIFIVAISIVYNQGIGMNVANETGTESDPGAGGTVQNYETSTAWANIIIALLIIAAIILGAWFLLSIL